MKRITFKHFGELPVNVRVMYIISMIVALIGIVLLLLNIFEIGNVRLAVAMAFVVASQIINCFALRGYRDRMCK